MPPKLVSSCPLCGSATPFIKRTEFPAGVRIGCNRCELILLVAIPGPTYHQVDYDRAAAAAIKRWNKRAKPRGAKLMPKKLVKTLHELLDYEFTDELESYQQYLADGDDGSNHVIHRLIELSNWLHDEKNTVEDFIKQEV